MTSKEDLLKLLDEAPEGRAGVSSNNVVVFISRFNIVEGNSNVPEKTLHRLYKTSTKDPVSKSEFVKLVSGLLIRHQSGSSFYYKLNIDAMNVSNEILKLASENKQDKTKSLQYIRTYENFLSKFDVERGNNWLEGYVLFELFAKSYRASGRRVPIGYNYFIQFCKLYFEEKRIGSNRCAWFGISKGIANKVSVETIDRIRKRRKNGQKKRRGKKDSRERTSRIEEKEREVQGVETRDESKE